MRINWIIVVLFSIHNLAFSQNHLWRVTLADHTTIDSLTLASVDRDSLYVMKSDTLRGLPLADIVEVRKPKHVNLASYVLVGAFTGIPIGFIARATDASARAGNGDLLPYVGEGALIGTTGSLLLAWLSSQDEYYDFRTEGRTAKRYLLQDIVQNEETKISAEQREDSVSAREEHNPLRHWITVDYGAGKFNSIGRGWYPKHSVRIGYGYGPSQNLTFCGHLDFYEDALGKEDGMFSRLGPTSAKRYEVALYGGWIILKIVEVGAGVDFRTSDRVYDYYFFDTYPPAPWGPSGTSEFRFFYVIGIGYQIPIAYGVMIPVGLHFRNSTAGDNGSPVLFRIGLGYRF